VRRKLKHLRLDFAIQSAGKSVARLASARQHRRFQKALSVRRTILL
jgi:hypothetical protein